MAKLGPVPGKSQGGNDSIENLSRKVGEMRTDDRTRNPRQSGTGGFAAGQRGGRGGRRPSTRTAIEVPTTDFDFESSNAKFNKQDLVREANATGSPLGTPAGDEEPKNPVDSAMNGSSANGAAAHDEDVVIPAAAQKTYNKSTSFFDNLSSEVKDRNAAQEEGKPQGGREFRGEERKKNFDTFGQANVDGGYRGGFRGRGGRGRGYGGRGRGSGVARGGYETRGGQAPNSGALPAVDA